MDNPKEIDRPITGLARVLEAAARVLNQRGVSQTSLAELADELGISRAALYYYFDDQQHLVFLSYIRSCERMAENIAEAMRASDNATTRIEAFIDLMLGDDIPECAALNEVAYLNPSQQTAVTKSFEKVRTAIADILKRGAAEQQLRSCRPGVVAASIIGLVSWLPTARRLPTSQVLSQEDLLDAIKSMLRVGIAADRRAAVEYKIIELSAMSIPAGRVFDADLMAAARKEAVGAAASWLFNLKGVDATSLEEIASRLGVTKKVIYHNVGDKETVVAECYRRSFRISEQVSAKMSAYEGLAVDAICASVHAYAEASLREDIAPLAPLAGLEEAMPEMAKGEVYASTTRLSKAALKVYEKGRRDGSIRKVNPHAMMNVIPGSYEWLPKWVEMFSAREREAAPREVAELMRLGLMPIANSKSSRLPSLSRRATRTTRGSKS